MLIVRRIAGARLCGRRWKRVGIHPIRCWDRRSVARALILHGASRPQHDDHRTDDPEAGQHDGDHWPVLPPAGRDRCVRGVPAGRTRRQDLLHIGRDRGTRVRVAGHRTAVYRGLAVRSVAAERVGDDQRRKRSGRGRPAGAQRTEITLAVFAAAGDRVDQSPAKRAGNPGISRSGASRCHVCTCCQAKPRDAKRSTQAA